MNGKMTNALLDRAQLGARGELPRVTLDVRLAILGQRVVPACQSEMPVGAARKI
jgi:hypothetical protein